MNNYQCLGTDLASVNLVIPAVTVVAGLTAASLARGFRGRVGCYSLSLGDAPVRYALEP